MLPIRWRLTLFNAIALLVITTGLTIALFGILGVSVQDIVEESTRQRANEAARIIEDGGGFERLDDSEFSEPDVALVAFDANGAIIYRVGHDSPLDGYVGQVLFTSVLGATSTLGSEITFDSSIYDRDPQVRAGLDESYVFAVPVGENEAGVAVIAASRSYDAVGGGRFGLLVVLGGAVLLLLVLVAIVGSYWTARAALKPINAFVASAEAMSGDDLSRRLPVGSGKRNELDRLATTFNRLLDRLQRAFRDRERALDEQRQFTQDASHELRTPLTSILGYTRILRTWGADDPATREESIGAIEREATRMHTMVERLLTLAKGDADAWLQTETVDLRELAERSAAQIRVASAPAPAIEVALPPAPVFVEAEPDLIVQAIEVLLENAVKFSPPDAPIALRVVGTTAEAAVVVQDEGPGISPEDLPRIFDRFYRAETSRTTPGTGLGLAIAQSITQRHKGRIEVESTPGMGATFTITLPRAQPDSAAPGTRD